MFHVRVTVDNTAQNTYVFSVLEIFFRLLTYLLTYFIEDTCGSFLTSTDKLMPARESNPGRLGPLRRHSISAALDRSLVPVPLSRKVIDSADFFSNQFGTFSLRNSSRAG